MFEVGNGQLIYLGQVEILCSSIEILRARERARGSEGKG